MQKLKREQMEALKRVWLRNASTNPATYLQFRRTVQYGYDCIMLPWAGMWLGIETDGYTHS